MRIDDKVIKNVFKKFININFDECFWKIKILRKYLYFYVNRIFTNALIMMLICIANIWDFLRMQNILNIYMLIVIIADDIKIFSTIEFLISIFSSLFKLIARTIIAKKTSWKRTNNKLLCKKLNCKVVFNKIFQWAQIWINQLKSKLMRIN